MALFLMLVAVYYSFSALIPNEISTIDTPENKFSTHRALIHLKEISKEAHYLGSEAHTKVRDYIITELKTLGLESQIQEGYAFDDNGNLAKAKNILARIKGTEQGKALLLLTHYDSDPHSSFGASDAGSGVVTILEGLRAFLSTNKAPKNDIIILFSDGEELGLTGANIFVNKHPWSKNVGLVVNFEARGSGGSGIMFIETNQGNANLIKEYVKANPQFPVGNSLFYSIYKTFPNDTDSTVFREDGDIDGFNFAFIDDHFDYHTALDNYQRLDRNSLEHQGNYLMSLLNYFSETNLSTLKSDQDNVYFNIPLFKTIIYPFSWIYPMAILALLIYIALIFYGFKKKILVGKEISKGFIALVTSLIIFSVIGFLLWKGINLTYPHYSEILQGFPYNGHDYIAAFVCLAIAVSLFVYHKAFKPDNVANLLIAPLGLWLIVCIGVAVKLEGASFFVIPLMFGLLSLFVLIRQTKPNIILLALFAVPCLTIFSPFLQLFPVGLGLKIIVGSSALAILMFGLLISVFGFFKHKKRWSFLFVFMFLYFMISAHSSSHFSKDNPKPNSLLYILNTDTKKANWLTYDRVLDNWTKNVFDENPQLASALNDKIIDSKYNSLFSYAKEAPLKEIDEPIVNIINDTITNDVRSIKLSIIPQRCVNRIELFSDSTNVFTSFKANSVELKKDLKSQNKDRLLTYFVADDAPLELEFSVPKNQKTSFTILEASYDLLNNDLFNIPERESYMIPKPFVLNDAIIVKKIIAID